MDVLYQPTSQSAPSLEGIMSLSLFQETNEMRDPSYSYQLNSAHYEHYQMYFVSFLALYVLYLVYLALRAFGELRAMNFLDAR